MRHLHCAARLTAIAVLISPTLWAVDWDPISPETLAITAPRIDPNADSETIFWQVWLEDRLLGGRQPQTMETQYLRVKIFTERGVEQMGADLLRARQVQRSGALLAATRQRNLRCAQG